MPYRNQSIPGAYNDLSYANIDPVIQQRPVAELTELYKTKKADYEYVQDNLNQLDMAISSTPHREQDRPILEEARNQLKKSLEDYSSTGDFENRKLDVNTLVKDVSKKLLPVQQAKKQESAYIEKAMSKDKEGNLIHSMSDIKRAVADMKRTSQPLEYDPELDTYVGGVSGREILPKINFSDRVAKILDDWKANKVTLKDSKGNPLERLGNGYLKAGEVEYTDESELINAAKAHLRNDPDFMDRVQDDMYYELNNLLLDEEGNRREMSIDDIKGRVTGDLKSVSTELGLGDKSLEEQIRNKDITPEELYSRIRLEQMTNSAIQLGVSKESYQQYTNKYLKDDLLIKSLEWQNENRTKLNKPIDDNAYVAIDRISTNQVIDPADYNSVASGYAATRVTIQDARRNLNLARQSGTPQQIQEQEAILRKESDNLENYERQLKAVKTHIESESNFNYTPFYEKYVQDIKNDRIKARLFNEGRRTEEEILEDNPMLSREQYEHSVIDHFIKGDTGSIVGNNIEAGAKALKDAYGGGIDSKSYTQDYYRYIIEGDSKDSKLYTNFVKGKQDSFQLTPDNFINEGKNFSTILKEKYDVELDEIDRTKSKVYPLVGSIGKKPGYMIDVIDKEGNEVGKVFANHEGDLIGDSNVMKDIAIGEAWNRFADKDISTLSTVDKALYRKLALGYVDNSIYGSSLDDLNLYVANSGEGLPYKPDGKNTMFIVTPQENVLSPTSNTRETSPDMVYHLTTPDGKTYLKREDENGIEQSIWAEKEAGDIPVDFNNPSEIKEILGASLLKQELNNRLQSANINPYSGYLNSTTDGNYRDISSIFGANIGNNVLPFVHKDNYEGVSSLKADYPSIVLTEGIRPKDVGYGSSTSNHIEGGAIDLRSNKDSIAITKLRPDQLKKYGIKSASVHIKGTAPHVHIVFL